MCEERSAQRDQFNQACDYLLLDANVVHRPARIVFIVGAGASNAACGLPTGPEAAKRLKDGFKGKVDDTLIQNEIHRLAIEYRLRESDFETVLLALSKFDQSHVLGELRYVFGRRHHTWIGYEILAHLLKHRFIDAIVNFNFDELLDQAIDDELGENGYYRIVSDGDCPMDIQDWIDKDRSRFAYPVYVKPHGTASHKSSMRFTRASYTLIPEDLIRILERLFTADGKPVCIVVIGHRMQSLELNELLSRASEDQLECFFIADHTPDLRLREDQPLRARHQMHLIGIQGTRDLSFWMKALWDTVEQQFKPDARPRSIERHSFLARVFSDVVQLGPSRDPQRHLRERDDADRLDRYLRDRIYIEIALAVAKAKGFVSLEDLAKTRVGRYYRLYRSKRASASKIKSLGAFCTDLGLVQYGYSRDTICLPTSARVDSENRLKRPTLEQTEFEQAAIQLAQKTLANISDQCQERLKGDPAELMRIFRAMYEGAEVEVSATMGLSASALFSDAVVLPTLTAMQVQTRQIVCDGQWDSIVCTSESGQWLTRGPWVEVIKERRANMALVVADETHRDQLVDLYGECLGAPPMRIRWLPWWLHNRHVTVFLHQRVPVCALFSDRRLRTAQIAPLYLRESDAKTAWDSFVAYWIKAEQYSKVANEVEIRRDRLQQEQLLLIQELYGEPASPLGAR